MNAVIDWLLNNYIEIFGAVAGIIYVFLEIRQNIWLWPVGIITSAVYIYVFFTGKLYADMSLQGYYLAISVVGWYWWGRKKRGSEEEKVKRRGGEEEMGGAGERGRGNLESPLEGGEGGVKTERLRDEETKGQKGSYQGLPSSEGLGVGLETERLRDLETERLRDEGTKGLKVSRLTLKAAIILAIVFAGLFAIMWFVLDRFTDSPVPLWDSFITSLSIVATWMLARKIYEHWFLWILVNFAAAILFFTRGLYPTVVLYFIYLVMSFAGLKAWKGSIEPR